MSESLPSAQGTGNSYSWLVGINSSVTAWSTLVLNVADLSRMCMTQRDQMVGQSVGMPLPFTLAGWIGILAAGATQIAYGTAAWQIPQYFSVWPAPAAVIGSIVLAADILVVNTAANLLSPMNDFRNMAPERWVEGAP